MIAACLAAVTAWRATSAACSAMAACMPWKADWDARCDGSNRKGREMCREADVKAGGEERARNGVTSGVGSWPAHCTHSATCRIHRQWTWAKPPTPPRHARRATHLCLQPLLPRLLHCPLRLFDLLDDRRVCNGQAVRMARASGRCVWAAGAACCVRRGDVAGPCARWALRPCPHFPSQRPDASIPTLTSERCSTRWFSCSSW